MRAYLPCSVCGEPTGWRVTQRDSATHPHCKPTVHGTRHAYRQRGCRCDECRAWNAGSFNRYKRLRRDQGRPLDKGKNIPAAIRLAVYERDGWTCQLCGQPTDPTAHPNADWYPSIDHIEPVSTGNPDHSERNLRTTHRWCNCIRGAAKVEDEAFQARR